MLAKLGLEEADESDMGLIMDTFSMLHEHRVDYTRFFRGLSNLHDGTAPVRDLFTDRSVDEGKRYEARLQKETRGRDQRAYAMRRVNPKYILRNYLAQQVILEAQNGDYEPMKELFMQEKPLMNNPSMRNTPPCPGLGETSEHQLLFLNGRYFTRIFLMFDWRQRIQPGAMAHHKQHQQVAGTPSIPRSGRTQRSQSSPPIQASRNLPGSVISELNKAYWVAVNEALVMLTARQSAPHWQYRHWVIGTTTRPAPQCPVVAGLTVQTEGWSPPS